MTELTCVVVDGDKTYAGAQGFAYFARISGQSAGARAVHMHRLEISPGGSAHQHLHGHHETAIYVLEGRAEMRYGEGLPNEQESVVLLDEHGRQQSEVSP